MLCCYIFFFFSFPSSFHFLLLFIFFFFISFSSSFHFLLFYIILALRTGSSNKQKKDKKRKSSVIDVNIINFLLIHSFTHSFISLFICIGL